MVLIGQAQFVIEGQPPDIAHLKQSVVSRSSAKAEFRAMAHGFCEGIWLKRLLQELQVSMA